jgi:hypothetical protein
MLEVATEADPLDGDLYRSLSGLLVCFQTLSQFIQQSLSFPTCVLRHGADAT